MANGGSVAGTGSSENFTIRNGQELLVAISVSLFLTGLYSISVPDTSETSDQPAKRIVDWLEWLPADPGFYFFVFAVVAGYFGWRLFLYAKICKEFEAVGPSKPESGLTFRDWWTALDLRKRGHALRTRAGAQLGGAFALLFGGIYLFIFIIPRLSEADFDIERDAAEARLAAKFRGSFESTVQSIEDGRYWLMARESEETTADELGAIANVLFNRLDIQIPLSRRIVYKLPALNVHRKRGKQLEIISAIEFDKISRTTDGGHTWNIPEELAEKGDSRVTAAAFGADGQRGVLGYLDGSVFVTQDGGLNWKEPSWPSLQDEDWLAALGLFGKEGTYGIAGSSKGNIFVTKDGGVSWAPGRGLELDQNEVFANAALDADGGLGVVGGDEGSVFVTKDGGENWTNLGNKDLGDGYLKLRDNEWLTEVGFFGNNTIVAGGDEGSVFVIKDDGGQWTWTAPDDLDYLDDLEENGWVLVEQFPSGNGLYALAGSYGGPVLVSTDGGDSWTTPPGLELKTLERVVTAFFNEDGTHGVLGGDESSVLVTENGGETWKAPEGLALKEGSSEWVVSVGFGPDGRPDLIVGDEGSAFVFSREGGTWMSTGRDRPGAPFSGVVRTTSGGHGYMAIDSGAEIHVLKRYPLVKDLFGRSLPGQDYMDNADKVLRESVIGKKIDAFLKSAEVDDFLESRGRWGAIRSRPESTKCDGSAFCWPTDSEKVLLRVATLTILFFLVQLLVRNYRYNIRLAAFWESRSDAVLLASTFARHPAEGFDDLVGAMAPDGYDFKAPPASGMAWMGRFRMRPRDAGGGHGKGAE